MTKDDVSDIRRCCDSFCKQVNLVVHVLVTFLRRKLFQSSCLYFSGFQLRNLSHKELQYLNTAWRKAIRRV